MAKAEAESVDLPYWILAVNSSPGEEAYVLLETIQHPQNAQTSQNEAITV